MVTELLLLLASRSLGTSILTLKDSEGQLASTILGDQTKMFRAVIVALVVACAMGFAPVSRMARSASIKMMEGSSIETGFIFPPFNKAPGAIYDPLDMLKLHERNPEVFPHPKWLRESELKHGRAAMLASVGAFTGQYGLTIPGYTAVADPVENLNQFIVNYPLGFAQIILAIGIIEGWSDPSAFWTGGGAREAGNLGYDPLRMSAGKPDKVKADFAIKELKNGRLAMIAMAAYTSEHWIAGSVPFLPGHF